MIKTRKADTRHVSRFTKRININLIKSGVQINDWSLSIILLYNIEDLLKFPYSCFSCSGRSRGRHKESGITHVELHIYSIVSLTFTCLSICLEVMFELY